MLTMSLNLQKDKEILEEYARGNVEQAVNEIVRRYKNFVYLVAFRYVNNYDDAEDITQEVFIEVLQKFKYFRQESTIKTWLYRVAVNKSKNWIRKKKFLSLIRLDGKGDDNETEFDIPDYSQDNKLENKEMEEIFLQVVANLPEKQREVFSLRYFEHMSFEEISNLLGTSVGGLKANYFHAVRKIASAMKQYLEE